MKGIILAAGSGTRLYPLTQITPKPLLPIYDKPMIYYPLETLKLAGISEILIITSACDLPRFKTLLGNGKGLGLNLSFAVQTVPKGIAEAFIIAKDFIGDDEVALILGDNIFDGNDLFEVLSFAVRDVSVNKGAHLLGYYVEDPERFGIVDFDTDGHVLSIEEKPKNPKSNYCITGLYFYDSRVVEYASRLKPSARGELEITDINKMYLEDGNVDVSILDNDNYMWIDAGTFDSLAEATQYMKSKSKRAYSA